MKTAKTILFTLIFILSCTATQAQFFEKLAKKAEDKIAREAENRAERRVNNKIDKTFDTAEEGIDGIGKKSKKKKKNNNTTNLPISYSFDWEYTLKMESPEIEKQRNKAKKKNKDIADMKIIYLLSSNSSAFGSKIEMSGANQTGINMISIIDFKTGTNISLMEMNGQKILQKMPSITDEDIEEQTSENYTIVKTDTKVILGYQCQGFKVTSDDGIINMYVAKNAPISFSGLLKNTKLKMSSSWFKEFENGLMMEMEFKSNKKEKYNMKMTCVSLEKKTTTLNLSEYKSFMEMGGN